MEGTASLVTVRMEEKNGEGDVLQENIRGKFSKDIVHELGPHVINSQVYFQNVREYVHFEGVHIGSESEPSTLGDLNRFLLYIWPMSQIVPNVVHDLKPCYRSNSSMFQGRTNNAQTQPHYARITLSRQGS